VIAAGMATFRGVKRRQEPRGEFGGVLVIDDFAHHPTAVRETIDGIRRRYPDRRLWAVFEPRSNTSRRNIHQADYEGAFDGADRVTIRVPETHDKVPADQQLDVAAIVAALDRRGIEASALRDPAEMAQLVCAESRANDLILVMSNGSFGGFIPLLLSGLEAREREGRGVRA
jgi:UDP-N-acetylmuramate: L-alanyl-gamma-D-glutamyl-meso-diaminopimelate ligase